MVVFQITANVDGPKDVAIVSTSWPAGNNIGKHAFKSSNIFVEVKARSSSNVLVRVGILSYIFFRKSCYSENSTHLHGCRNLVH